MKILVLVAHPDDETIICGGTIDKLINRDYQVEVGFYTKNEQAFFGKETQPKRVKRTIRETKKSSQVLGFGYKFLGFKDMELQKDKGELIQATIKEIRRVKPDIIITHGLNDRHIDHRSLAEVVPEANWQSDCLVAGGSQTWRAGTVLQGEVDLEMTTGFTFQLVSALSLKNIQQKIKAFSCYQSVKNEHPADAGWLEEKIKITARLRGQSINVKYGEAFSLSRFSPVNAASLALLAQVLK